MEIQKVYRFAGDATTSQMGAVIAIAAGKLKETRKARDRYAIEWDVSDLGTVPISSGQVVAGRRGGYIVDISPLLPRFAWEETVERPSSPEAVVEISISKREPEPVDDLDWLISNMSELRRQYAGHWIAITQGQVVASALTLPELVEVTEARGIESPFVTFISDEEITWNMAYG